MNIRAILAIVRKDTIDIVANKATLFGLLTPILMVLIFAAFNALIGNGDKPKDILVYNPGNSPVEKLVGSSFEHVNIIHARTANDVSAAFGKDGSQKETDYALGLIVPDGFEASLRQGGHPAVSLYINDDKASGVSKDALTAALSGYASSVTNPQPLQISVATINPTKGSELPISTLLGSFYSSIALVMSFLTGMTVVPNLLVEEKEKKTLRLLMVSPAGFADIITGKLLIALVYQLAMTAAVLLTMKSLSGNIPLLCLFTLCGACFTLALGLLAGCIFQTTTALGGFTGLMTMLFLFPAMFASDLIGTLLKGNPLEYVVRAIPTYYLADGFAKAIQNQGFNSTILLDLGVVAGCVAILIVASTVLLRRQASIAATI